MVADGGAGIGGGAVPAGLPGGEPASNPGHSLQAPLATRPIRQRLCTSSRARARLEAGTTRVDPPVHALQSAHPLGVLHSDHEGEEQGAGVRRFASAGRPNCAAAAGVGHPLPVPPDMQVMLIPNNVVQLLVAVTVHCVFTLFRRHQLAAADKDSAPCPNGSTAPGPDGTAAATAATAQAKLASPIVRRAADSLSDTAVLGDVAAAREVRAILEAHPEAAAALGISGNTPMFRTVKNGTPGSVQCVNLLLTAAPQAATIPCGEYLSTPAHAGKGRRLVVGRVHAASAVPRHPLLKVLHCPRSAMQLCSVAASRPCRRC